MTNFPQNHLSHPKLEDQLLNPIIQEQLHCHKNQQWLNWLESKLSQDTTEVFFIDKMQESWLETSQKRWYRLGVGLISGLLIALIYGISTGWIGASIGGITYGLILANIDEIYPITRLKVSWEFAKICLFRSLLEGLWWGVVYGIIDAIICGLIWGVEGLIIGMGQVLIWGLIEGIIWGICVPDFEDVTVSNQGIRESAKNAVIFTILGGVAWSSLYVLVLLALGEIEEPLSIIIDGISCGLFFGIYVGGLACIQHFVLRFILWIQGCIPWNYTKFLNSTVEQGFLEYSQGGYRVVKITTNS